jgi:stage II sporulation protein D
MGVPVLAALAATVLVRVLQLFHPSEARVAGERVRAAELRAPREWVGPVTVELKRAHFRREFPGRLRVRASRARELIFVAEVDLEEYVAAVVAAEMEGHADADGALRAQAVLARTFALGARASGRHAREGYDLCDTTHCQVWKGALPSVKAGPDADAAAAPFRDAAEATRGLVLLWRGAPAEVYYHAHCGGRTADPADLWPGHERLPYLAAKDDPHPPGDDASWTFSAPAAEVRAALGGVNILSVPSRDGRVPERIRLALGRRYGWSRIPSGRFTAAPDGARIVLRGTGSGHGAGLCQSGAVRMSRAGAPFRDILRFYFPGSEIGPFEPVSTSPRNRSR